MHWRSSSQRSTHSWDPSSWCSAEFEPEQTAKPKESILTYLETKSKNSWERGHFEVQLASFLQLGAPFGERHRPVSATFHSSHRWPSTTFRFLPANISLTDIAFTRLIHRLLARSAGSLSTWTLPSTMDRLELLVWERGTNSDCFAFWDRLEKNACEFKNGSVLKNQLAICAPSSPCSSLFPLNDVTWLLNPGTNYEIDFVATHISRPKPIPLPFSDSASPPPPKKQRHSEQVRIANNIPSLNLTAHFEKYRPPSKIASLERGQGLTSPLHHSTAKHKLKKGYVASENKSGTSAHRSSARRPWCSQAWSRSQTIPKKLRSKRVRTSERCENAVKCHIDNWNWLNWERPRGIVPSWNLQCKAVVAITT